jgi:poly(A) polymerase
LPGSGSGSKLIRIMEFRLKKIMAFEGLRVMAELAAGLGIEAFLVGGALRDSLLGREINDLDLALSGAYAELPSLFAERAGGTFFWLDEARLQARVVVKKGASVLVYDFAPLRGGTIDADLALRDFTVNALAVPLAGESKVVIDPLGGLADLSLGLIRACSLHAFDDDPLRLLRAVRCAAELRFAVAEDTWNVVRNKAGLLGRVAAERVRDELFRTLAAPGVGASLRKLWESGLWREIAPVGVPLPEHGEVGRRTDCAEGVARVCAKIARLYPEHKERLAEYLESEAEAGVTMASLMNLAAFLGSGDKGGAASLAERLRLGKQATRVLELLCRDERTLFDLLEREAPERAMHRFYRDREPAGLGMVIAALATGVLSERCVAGLAGYYLCSYQAGEGDLYLAGGEIMNILGTGPGVAVGEAMACLREAEGTGRVGSREEAREFVKNLLTKKESMR